jgi:outer membrane protein TolC
LFRIRLSVAAQRLKVDAAQFSFDVRQQKLVDDVRQSYYQVLQSQLQYESQQSTVKYLQELLQLTDRRVSQRAALEADKLSVKAELAKAIYQLTTIEDGLADCKPSIIFWGAACRQNFRWNLFPQCFPNKRTFLRPGRPPSNIVQK